ncbi:hypothetical protein EMIHUDRAFT_453755 [Emiliania huxleyi CCMP1516]|uniref:Ribosome maturation protein SBDS n=5 Tax=Emiliania huxleyi TaxID=2903 RepID=A0A0D3I0N0_EMIH1|nr:hypothetical protein EMIHUDRAFT_453755 [Emiliania huxleyi CCMP1516]EOD04815.1 hypothetical protein EMIHUDRAFT_453755 [Emiliania huxleyi CCMP1516]|eukprot:XP_005757244.1 hypothetical protein EMIHUDRAFT_453755 [Emiliania huxleyi CCMP1516]
MSQFLPSTQKRLTNIAVVRYKRAGKKFEVACYKNTIIAWRNKVETDIDEVLQAHTIYADIGRGVLAKREDLIEAFGTDDEDAVCVEILNKGEFQVSEQERHAQLDALMRDIAARVADMVVNPDTGRPYPQPTIERAMRETIHFAPSDRKSAKQQALLVIKALQASEAMPIERAHMRLRLLLPQAELGEARERLQALAPAGDASGRLQLGEAEAAEEREARDHAATASGSGSGGAEATPPPALSALPCSVDPSLYRPIAALVGELGGAVHVVALKAAGEAEEADFGLRAAPGLDPRDVSPAVPPRAAAAAAAAAPPTAGGSGGGRGGGGGAAPRGAVGKGAGKGKGSGTTAAAGRGGGDAAQDARRAERMFRLNLRSAEAGDPVAQLEVGKAYLHGAGAAADPEQARRWLEQAALQGVHAAKAHLEQISSP